MIVREALRKEVAEALELATEMEREMKGEPHALSMRVLCIRLRAVETLIASDEAWADAAPVA